MNINQTYVPVKQKKHIMAKERNAVVNKEVQALVTSGVMRAMQFPGWITNLILVKKSDGTMQICVEFTDLNKACQKDSYPLPEIEHKD